uniref:NADH-ubiquinone oxidoreductase chain 6 n=1 Tax=Trabala vishnou guttata TaxID=1418837 RepID=A0A1U7AF23_9NEOP|nr:NADH dehydrogenase subunit 6 [Trabala vishnou]AOV63372.1 NADH dehydrogenase subunit 6 [Trabala vishnou guttata]UNP54583.1 NADH dehydrogenase subunit 6 [Trabala vishnou]
MLKLSLSFMMLMMSFIMYSLTHPLSMGLMILTQTLLMCLLTGMLIKTYWFSYILFLTFLGGLLVLFIYVTSIASNELFSLNFNSKIYYLILFMFILIFSLNFYNLNWMNLSFNLEMINLFFTDLFFNNENKMNLNKLYNNQTYMMMMMMIIYLFITMIAIVKITNIFYGPLRSS